MIFDKIKKEWNQLKRSPSLLAILLAILGVILFIRPHRSLGFVVRAGAVILLAEGGMGIYKNFQNPVRRSSGMVMRSVDILMALAGLFILLRPGFLIRLFPAAIGMVLILYGALRLWMWHMPLRSAFTRENLPLSVVQAFPLALGIFLFFFPNGAVDIAVRLIGAYLVLSLVARKVLPRLFPSRFPRMESFFWSGEEESFLNSRLWSFLHDENQEDVAETYYGSPDDIEADYKVIDDD